MEKIIKSIPKVFIDDTNNTIVISIPNNLNGQFLFQLICRIFEDKCIFFEASGLLDTMEDMINNLNENITIINKGDGNKFFIKKMPKLYSIIENQSQLIYILDEWVSTIYEKRKIYILDSIYKSNIISNFQKYLLNMEKLQELLESKYEYKIENIPEADSHYTFKISCKKDFFLKILEYIKVKSKTVSFNIIYIKSNDDYFN